MKNLLFFLLQLRVLSLLKDLGSMLLHDENVKLLVQLLDKRSQYYFKLDITSQPISDTEVDLLCLLLEVNSFSSFVSEENLPNALHYSLIKFPFCFSLPVSVLHDAISIV